MSPLTQEQIDFIAQQVVGRFSGKTPAEHAVLNMDMAPITETSAGMGIFWNMDAAVKAATEAHHKLMTMTLKQRDEIIASIRRMMMENAHKLADMAHEESGLGRRKDKYLKNTLVTEKTPGTEALQPVVFSGDHGLALIELAPYGVIGSITPVTNPTSTIICNTIGMVAAGNSVVYNVHPSAKNVSNYTVSLINQAITWAGGPENLVVSIAEPTIESAQALMAHPGIRLLVVTGGAGVVKAAMSSGKRAICAGPGNPPVVVDETADIEHAAKSIVQGASMDNGIICILEKEVFVVESIADRLIEALSRNNAVILTPDQIDRLDKIIFAENRGPRKHSVMEKTLIGKNIQIILEKIGMQVEESVRLAVAPVPEDHPLVWTEQMMPVLPLVRMPNADMAIDIAREAEHGFGHTAIMHSKNLDNLSRMAKVMNCSIFVKNSASLAGLGYGGEGFTSFTIASPTGEGLTNPRSFSRERRCTLVDHFRIV